MKPVITPAQAREMDARASVSGDELILRAARAVVRNAKAMLGGYYGRRVVVIAGKGNNGADGRLAAKLLEHHGVGVRLYDAGSIDDITDCDLVIDAAYGTGFRGSYDAPPSHGIPVLAVDVPSGLDAETGEAKPRAVRADRTVTFAALKPGLLFGAGPSRSGRVVVEDIGLDASDATLWLVDDSDMSAIPSRESNSHKWRSAVAVVAGSPGMTGAAVLCAAGAQRSGSGMVRLLVPGAADLPPSDAVFEPLPDGDWASVALNAAERSGAIVIGPGLGRSDETISNVLALLEKCDAPAVLDADALFAVSSEKAKAMLKYRVAPTILTPHDGEFHRLTGLTPSPRRWKDAQDLARATDSVVLLKGPATVVADSTERVLVANSGDQRLATAGTGDVLAGIIGALLAQGTAPTMAAALGAHIHGRAAKLGRRHGFSASDLPGLVARWLTESREK